MTKRARRVLIYRIGSLGDTVVALPSLHLVARAFPDAERRLLTNFPIEAKAPPAAAVLENTGLVDGYFRYAIGTRSPRELLRLWWQITRWRPHVLVYLGTARGIAAARRDARFFRLCGVQELIGIPATEEEHDLLVDGGLLEFEAQRLARMVAELGDAKLDNAASWDLRLTAEEKARAAGFLGLAEGRPLIAMSLGTKMQANEWGKENWRQLLTRLAAIYPQYALAITGVGGEREASEYIAQGWREAGRGAGPVLNLCGELSPREAGAVFATARIFLGHDSGPMHLAAAAQTRCVAVFSARCRPKVWFPYGEGHRVLYHRVDCWGCNLETCITEGKKCILSISVDEVLSEIRSVLDDPIASSSQRS